MKHINSYRVENIPGKDPKLLAAISLPNLEGMKKKMIGLKIVLSFSPKCVLPNPCKILKLYLLIYIEHKGTIGLWSNKLYKSNGEDRTMSP